MHKITYLTKYSSLKVCCKLCVHTLGDPLGPVGQISSTIRRYLATIFILKADVVPYVRNLPQFLLSSSGGR